MANTRLQRPPCRDAQTPVPGRSHPQPLRQAGAATPPPTRSSQPAPERWRGVKGNLSCTAKPQKLFPRGLGEGEEETRSKRGGGKIHSEGKRRPKQARQVKVQHRWLTQERRCKFCFSKQNFYIVTSYKLKLTLSAYHTHPSDTLTCPVPTTFVERRTALYANPPLVHDRSLGTQAITCPCMVTRRLRGFV